MFVLLNMSPLLFLIACSNSIEAEEASVAVSPEETSAAAPPQPAPPPRCPETVAQLPAAPFLDATDPRLHDDLIVINKSRRTLLFFSSGTSEDCWDIGLGFAPRGHKEQEGDGRTPEGWYRTSDKPWSSFYAAIAVHYPNIDDAAAGRDAGRISEAEHRAIVSALRRDEKPKQTTEMGGEILIHGGGSASDWTLGCVALNNNHIDILRTKIPANMRTNVLILP